MTSPLEQALSRVRALSGGDRQKLLLWLKNGAGNKPGASGGERSAKANIASDWLLWGVLAELKRRGLSYREQGPADIRRLAPNYEAASEPVRAQLERCLRQGVPTPGKVELYALGSLAARALAEYMESWEGVRVPIGLKSLLNNIGKTLEAVDQSYPGYLRCGLIHCLLRYRKPRRE